MSYLLKEVIDNLDGAGFIMCDEDLAFESLNDELGLNVHHDIVITSPEIAVLGNALTSLQVWALADGNEFFVELAEKALNILEVK